MELVFSYGSLTGMFPEYKKAELFGKYDIDRSNMFPRLIDSTSLNSVEGYLIRITKEDLEIVDRYEGYPDLYNRKKVLIYVQEEGNIQAWVYY